MVIKMLLIIPTSVLVTTNKLGTRTANDDASLAAAGDSDRRSNLLRIQSVLTLVILGIYAVLAWLSAPFLDPVCSVGGLQRQTATCDAAAAAATAGAQQRH